MAKNTKAAAVDDFAERRRNFLGKLGENLQAAASGKLPANASIKSKEQHLERLRGRLEDARDARETALKRFDHEIETFRGEITRLEREIYQEQAQLKKAEKGGKPSSDSKKDETPKKEASKKDAGKTTRKVARK